MRNKVMVLFVLALFLVSSANAAEVDELAIQGLLAQRSDLFNAQEYEKLVPLFAKDKQAARAAIISKQKDNWKSKGLKLSSPSVESLNISGDKATSVYTYEMNGSKKTEKVSFVKESDCWKIEDIQ